MAEHKDDALLPARFIYEPVKNDPGCRFANRNRNFQGIPGIERTSKGRFFVTFYGGMSGEESGNFVVLLKGESYDADFREPYMVVEAPTPECRVFDPCLWIDDTGRLWLFYAQSYSFFDGRIGVWAAVCDDPDADKTVFSAPKRIANGIMMNKPVILSSGEWLACCSIWNVGSSEYNYLPEERFSNVYCSTDKGESYSLIGHTDYEHRSIDEHMIVELKDGRLWMLIRAKTGIGQGFSDDKGCTWYDIGDSGLGGPCSRFHIRRLKSGRLLLVNHHDFAVQDKNRGIAGYGRSNLKAMLSDDDGKTWHGFLMIDERENVSYPDVTEDEEGNIYIIYDRERYTEREILMAKITEDDITAGKLVSPESKLRVLVNKGGI